MLERSLSSATGGADTAGSPMTKADYSGASGSLARTS